MGTPTSQTIDQVKVRSKADIELDREAMVNAAERRNTRCNQFSSRLNEVFMLIKYQLVFASGLRDSRWILRRTSASSMIIAQYNTLDPMYRALTITYMYKALMAKYEAITVACKVLILVTP